MWAHFPEQRLVIEPISFLATVLAVFPRVHQDDVCLLFRSYLSGRENRG